jgi:hypothetical protein
MPNKRSTTPKKSTVPAREEPTAFFVPQYRPTTRNNASRLLMTMGGFQDQAELITRRIEKGDEPRLVVDDLANAVEAAIASVEKSAQPPPSDIYAMMRVADYFDRVEGDMHSTISIPAELILKRIEIACDDAGAKKEWERLWHETLDINFLNEDCYLTSEVLGQYYPLEIWDGEELTGIFALDPLNVWIGRHLITIPGGIPDGVDPKMWTALLEKEQAYQMRNADQNTQALVVPNRTPIPNSLLKPITQPKRSYQRYAVPHFARASRNAMHRQVLDEYRRGTIETFMSQLWHITIGDKDFPASPKKIAAVKGVFTDASKYRTGSVFTDHTIQVKTYVPTTLDKIMGGETYDELTRAIMWDLGFASKPIFGDSLGTGRPSTGDIEIEIQMAISRWKWRRNRFIDWCKHISKKYAESRNNDALRRHQPEFVYDAIEIEQARIIKDKLMPLFGAGALSTKTTLKDSGYNYDAELANKKDEKPDAELFAVRTTFAQTVTDGDGKEKSTSSKIGGRPSGSGSKVDGAAVEANVVEGQMPLVDRFRDEIVAHFDEITNGNWVDESENRKKIQAFLSWLETQLRARMIAAYQDGYRLYGGFADLTYELLEKAPQGIGFHFSHFSEYAKELESRVGDLEALARARFRATQYAGALHTAFVLGAQMAMQIHGATHWRRILHPELSIAGPCAQCVADAVLVHPISEPFTEFHPNGVCSAQSVMFGFGNRANITLPVRVVNRGITNQQGR